MSDYLADLRAVATEGAERTESVDSYTHSVGVMSPVLLALLDAVSEADTYWRICAEGVAPESDVDEAWENLGDALARVRALTGEDQT